MCLKLLHGHSTSSSSSHYVSLIFLFLCQVQWVFLKLLSTTYVSVQFSSVIQLCPILYDSMYCSTTGFPVQHQPPQLTQTHVHRLGDAKQPSHPLSSPSYPAFYLSQYQGLFNGSALLIRWQKYWSIRFTISPSNKYSGLISFRIDWMDLLAVQGTLKGLLQQFKSINSSVLSFIYSPTLTSIHDSWKIHSFD